MKEKEYLDGKFVIKIGDITKEKVDAIVNAANSKLLGGGGVDGAIHRAGGPEILEECKAIRKTKLPEGLPTGEAVITTGGNLPAKYVIHTVGPVWHGGKKNEPQLLQNAYHNCLKLAVEYNIKTIAFPSISTGVYGYPIDKAANISIQTIRDFISKNNFLDKVILVIFGTDSFDKYINEADKIF